jgi:hypothetical protein
MERIQKSSDTNTKDQDHHEYGFNRHCFPQRHVYLEEVSW